MASINCVDMKQQIQEIRVAVMSELAETLDTVNSKDIDLISNDDWQVERFLRRKNFNVPETIKMIINTMRWRHELGTPCHTDLDFPAEFFKVGVCFRYAKDRQNNGTLWIRARMMRPLKEMQRVVQQFVMHHLNVVDRNTKGRGMAVIFDCREASFANLDMNTLWFLVSSLINYCPEGLQYILVYDLPWMLHSVWRVVKGWLPSELRQWIKFANNDEIYNYISIESLPKYLGGKCHLNTHTVPEGCRSTMELSSVYRISEKDAKKCLKAMKPSLDYTAYEETMNIL